MHFPRGGRRFPLYLCDERFRRRQVTVHGLSHNLAAAMLFRSTGVASDWRAIHTPEGPSSLPWEIRRDWLIRISNAKDATDPTGVRANECRGVKTDLEMQRNEWKPRER